MHLPIVFSLASSLVRSSVTRIEPGTVDAVSAFASKEAKALSKIELSKPDFGWKVTSHSPLFISFLADQVLAEERECCRRLWRSDRLHRGRFC